MSIPGRFGVSGIPRFAYVFRPLPHAPEAGGHTLGTWAANGVRQTIYGAVLFLIQQARGLNALLRVSLPSPSPLSMPAAFIPFRRRWQSRSRIATRLWPFTSMQGFTSALTGTASGAITRSAPTNVVVGSTVVDFVALDTRLVHGAGCSIAEKRGEIDLARYGAEGWRAPVSFHGWLTGRPNAWIVIQ